MSHNARITGHFLGESPFYHANPNTQRQISGWKQVLTPFACLPGTQVVDTVLPHLDRNLDPRFGALIFFEISDILNIFSYRADTSIPTTLGPICVVDQKPGAYLFFVQKMNKHLPKINKNIDFCSQS